MNTPAFKAMTRMAKRPMTRLMAPQTMPRTAALRMVLRAQTTSRAWFWAESKTGWCDIDSGLEQTECRKGVEQKESVLARRGYRGEQRCGQLHANCGVQSVAFGPGKTWCWVFYHGWHYTAFPRPAVPANAIDLHLRENKVAILTGCSIGWGAVELQANLFDYSSFKRHACLPLAS